MNIFTKFLIVFTLGFSVPQNVFAGVFLEVFFDKTGAEITIERIDDIEISFGLPEQRVVFNEAFWAARVQSGLAQESDEKAKADFVELIRSSMDEVKTRLIYEKSTTFCLSARKGGRVVGFIVFSKDKEDGAVYINQCAILPTMWRLGIATHLFKMIMRLLPETKNIKFVVRRKNKIACDLYDYCMHKYPSIKQIDYCREGYDPRVYQGYEIIITDDFSL